MGFTRKRGVRVIIGWVLVRGDLKSVGFMIGAHQIKFMVELIHQIKLIKVVAYIANL